MPVLEEQMSDAEYRAGPWLTHSGAKLLLPPSCPAIYRWRRDHPEQKDTYDFGKVAHAIVLGQATDVIVVVDAPDWRTKDARDTKSAAREAGQTPILRKDYEVCEAMASQVRAHPIASALFDPSRGRPEVALKWRDPATAHELAMRLDWLPDKIKGQRMILADYKTAVTADPHQFGTAAARYGYATQAAWYQDGLIACGIDDDPAVIFVVQDKEPPYVVTVVQLDDEAIQIGRGINRWAIQTYARCVADDHWPGYSEDVELVSLPAWFVNHNAHLA